MNHFQKHDVKRWEGYRAETDQAKAEKAFREEVLVMLSEILQRIEAIEKKR